jgi:hypothetical protein
MTLTLNTEAPAPGVYRDVPREEYDKIDAANQSTLKSLLFETPAHARYEKLHGKASDALILGSLFHAMLLEPETVGGMDIEDPGGLGRFALWTGKTRQGNAWNAFRLAADALDLEIVRQQDVDACELMVKSLMEHQAARNLIERGGTTEATLIWHEGDVLCKARLDQLVLDRWVTLGDIKTASSVAPRDFSRAIVNHGYHVQAAMYLRGGAALAAHLQVEDLTPNYVITAIESSPRVVNAQGEPRHAVRCMELDLQTIKLGDKLLGEALDVYRSIRVSGRWDGYPQDIETTGAPEWALKEVGRG